MQKGQRWPLKFRAVFISDVHLGSRACRADLLLEFLYSVDAETVYLVGDIVDFWAMRTGAYWPQEHNNVLRRILGIAKRGTRVVYIPGNHDEVAREHVGSWFGNILVERETIHVTARGERLLVVHGDEFDAAVRCSPMLEWIGNLMYTATIGLNCVFNGLRRLLGFPYWSLAGYLKHRVANAMQHIERFEHAAAHAARRRSLDGIVCGHIHRAEMRNIDGIRYCNDGDWVETCSALVEDGNGRLSVLHWPQLRDDLRIQDIAVERAA
ncbi:MAG: UDP-2,3-diacylglucosamine diphosphatase [Steroidobacteraceae bacterium]